MSKRLSVPVSNKVLTKAIELRLSECFQAMNVANSLGGTSSPEWDLVRSASLSEMIDDFLDRGDIGSLKDVKAAVDNTPFMETRFYPKLLKRFGNRLNFPKVKEEKE